MGGCLPACFHFQSPFFLCFLVWSQPWALLCLPVQGSWGDSSLLLRWHFRHA